MPEAHNKDFSLALENNTKKTRRSSSMMTFNSMLARVPATSEERVSFVSIPESHYALSMTTRGCTAVDKKRLYMSQCKRSTEFDLAQRRDCWLTVTGARQAQVSNQPGYYKKLVNHCRRLTESGYPSVAFQQIKKDLNRTFSDEKFFNHQTTTGQQTQLAIERVCQAYAIRNTHVGYC